MIYSVYFSNFYYENRGLHAADFIKSAEEGDKFIFIITATQQCRFDEWVDTFGLKDLIIFDLPYYTTNWVHESSGRNVKLIVLGRQPITKGVDYAEAAGNCTGQA